MTSASRTIVRMASLLSAGGFALGFTTGFTGPAAAQSATSVSMVQQDSSDCSNANVKDNDGGSPGGTVWVVKNNDGSANLKVAISAKPMTTYNFYLKCVRQLGTIKTDEDGAGGGSFAIPAGGLNQVFAFDMYPDGAPAGNKFQSVQGRLR